MKVSIWQQFSSNHSSMFTIIGQFKSPEDASAAADKIRELFQGVHEYIRESLASDYDDYQDNPNNLSPAEKQFREKYNLEWDEHIGYWVDPDAVDVVDNIVIIGTGIDTHGGPYPVDELIRKLDGKSMIDGDRESSYGLNSDVYVTVTFKTSNKKSADELGSQLEQYKQECERNIWANQELRRIQRETRTTPTRTDYPSLYQPKMSPLWEEYGKIRGYMGKGFYLFTLNRVGLTISVKDIQCSLEEAFPAFIEWLKDQGCTDITYSFREEIDED